MIRAAIESVKSFLPGGVREVLWRLRHMPRRDAVRLLAAVRPADVLKALRAYYDATRAPRGPLTISLRGYPRPVVMRNGTSDFAVLAQVFLHGQYGRLPVHNPRVIIDAGANIGLASLYFLHRYPGARILALEPDPENLAVAEENLRPYRDRCTLVHGALWSSRTRLSLRRTGAHWATQVTPDATPGGIEVEAYSLPDIIRDHGLPSIDLLKIDIEGAEAEVFKTCQNMVFDRVGCCAVEIHGEVSAQAFVRAADYHNFDYWDCGELTIAYRGRRARAGKRLREDTRACV
jgi:FkbM family methyltransferase